MTIDWTKDPYMSELADANTAVQTAMNDLRVTQKSIPPITVDPKDNLFGVPDNKINFTEYTIPDRSDKPFVELYLEFYLTETGLNRRGRLKELAVALVPSLALMEDFYIFQMSDKSNALRDKGHPNYQGPAHVNITNWQLEDGYRDYGLLSEAHPRDSSDYDWTKVSKPIHVPLSADDSETLWGVNTARAVLEGIGKLMDKKGIGNKGFALFLPIKVWADAMLPISDDGPTTWSLIKPMGVDMEVLPCRVLPKDEGLLVNLVGDPIKIFYGQQPQVEPETVDRKYKFRLVERVQYVVSDPRALVLLKFEQPNHERRQQE
ncbi:hypothetical protein [uncultured Nostoc sp.]|uniref:hypothetical protein n=1 Tax=uncultured Nostoc sp. TaxID=340711 RepID=UPI0035CA1F6B